MSGKVWRVEIVFKKTVSTYVEADSIPEARRIITAAAADMDVMDSPGSDFDGWDVQVARHPREIRVVTAENEEAPVWRAGEQWALCDSAGERLAELSSATSSTAAEVAE